MIAQKPCYHRFELRYEHVVETTLYDGQRACILRAKLPDGRPQMRWLDAAQVGVIHQSVHHLFHFYQANVQQGENIRYAGTTQRHQQNCHRIVYRYPDGKQTIRYFNCVSGRLVSVVDWNGREIEVLTWSQVQGVHYPKRVVFSKYGKVLHTIDYTQIVANNRLDERLFAMPEIAKNRLEADLHHTDLKVFITPMHVINYSKSEQFEQDLSKFCALGRVPSDLSDRVSEILQAVKNGGDSAVLHYTKAFDGAQLQAKDLLVSASELATSVESLNGTERAAIAEAIEMVKAFHQHTLPTDWQTENKHGALVGERFYLSSESACIFRVGMFP